MTRRLFFLGMESPSFHLLPPQRLAVSPFLDTVLSFGELPPAGERYLRLQLAGFSLDVGNSGSRDLAHNPSTIAFPLKQQTQSRLTLLKKHTTHPLLSVQFSCTLKKKKKLEQIKFKRLLKISIHVEEYFSDYFLFEV